MFLVFKALIYGEIKAYTQKKEGVSDAVYNVPHERMRRGVKYQERVKEGRAGDQF